jgi:hypothetical protein
VNPVKNPAHCVAADDADGSKYRADGKIGFHVDVYSEKWEYEKLGKQCDAIADGDVDA